MRQTITVFRASAPRALINGIACAATAAIISPCVILAERRDGSRRGPWLEAGLGNIDNRLGLTCLPYEPAVRVITYDSSRIRNRHVLESLRARKCRKPDTVVGSIALIFRPFRDCSGSLMKYLFKELAGTCGKPMKLRCSVSVDETRAESFYGGLDSRVKRLDN